MEALESRLNHVESFNTDVVGLYEPAVDDAYKKMQSELEDFLEKHGRVEKVQTRECIWGETNEWQYKVYDKDGQLIAEVHYKQGQEQVVVAEHLKDESMKKELDNYFGKDFDKNLKKHAEEFRKKHYGVGNLIPLPRVPGGPDDYENLIPLPRAPTDPEDFVPLPKAP
ncbi:hypothetical protein ACFLZB_00220 [Nanoarchaeota archaeon]